MIGADDILLLRDDVVLEVFVDGVAVYQAADCRLHRLNETAQRVLDLLDGRRTVRLVAADLVAEYGEPADVVLADVAAILEQLKAARILKQRVILPTKNGCGDMSASARYLAKPNVSCRIEDAEGAILYDPDTDAVRVVNAVGIELWQTLSESRTCDELVAHLRQVCDGVTDGEVEADVKNFLSLLVRGGFVGEVAADHA